MTGVERTSTRIAGFASPEMDFQLMRQQGAATAGVGHMSGFVQAGEGAEALDQHKTFCSAVSGPATSRIFTVEEGADMHCQLGNLPLSNAVVYDWFADTLKD